MNSSEIQDMIGVEKQRHFIRAMCKSADAESVTPSESILLDELMAALLHGKDVSDLIGVKPAHARRPSDPIRIAIHYLCLTRLKHEGPDAAWRKVGDAWGLKKREVQWIIAGNWAPASAMLPRFTVTPDTLLRLCERHARGVRPERRRSMFKLPTRSESHSPNAT